MNFFLAVFLAAQGHARGIDFGYHRLGRGTAEKSVHVHHMEDIERDAFEKDWSKPTRINSSANISHCCNCPYLDTEKISRHTDQVRKLFDAIIPGKWFLVQGTLIGALRYGAHLKRMQSGKVNLVDSDMDVVVVIEGGRPDRRTGFIKSLKSALPGWTHEQPSWGDFDRLMSPEAIILKSCSKESNAREPFFVDVHYIEEHEDGQLRSPQTAYSRTMWSHWLGSDDAQTELPRDLFLPLQKVQWGSGVSWAPNKYVELLQFFNQGEYNPKGLSYEKFAESIWKPRDANLMSFENGNCRCKLSEADFSEIRASMQTLKDGGYASFSGTSTAEAARLLGSSPSLRVPGDTAGATHAREHFDMVYDKFRERFDGSGRHVANPQMNEISIDFEAEMNIFLSMTPDLLLMRSGIDLDRISAGESVSCAQNLPLIPSSVGSELVRVHIDSTKELDAVLELETPPMQLQRVLQSNMLTEMQEIIDSIAKDPAHSTHLAGTSLQYSKPFHPEQIWNREGFHPSGHLQYTVGLSMANVPSLLAFSDKLSLKKILTRVKRLCNHQDGGCHPEYKGLVVLASWVLVNADEWGRWGYEGPPKRCMFPWLVRTHFGDSAKYVEGQLGKGSLANFTKDVLFVSQREPDSPAWSSLVGEYRFFPEMAEIGGLVVPRTSRTNSSGITQELPTTAEGMCGLAAQVLEPATRRQVESKLKHLEPGLLGIGRQGTMEMQERITVFSWLEAMQKGQDLLSDVDSPLSSSGWRRLVWEAMGAWRMTKQTRGIVYLECRVPEECIPGTFNTKDPVVMIRDISTFLVDRFDSGKGIFKFEGGGEASSDDNAVSSHGHEAAVPQHHAPIAISHPKKLPTDPARSSSAKTHAGILNFRSHPKQLPNDPAGSGPAQKPKSSVNMQFLGWIVGGIFFLGVSVLLLRVERSKT